MSRSTLSVLRISSLFACTLIFAAVAHAQYRASIQGVVTDTQGAVIQGATITLKDSQTNRTVSATSDGNGVYNFAALPPSNYTVTAEKEGFKKKTLNNYSPVAEQSNALNLELEAGGSSETITVSADQLPAIDTQTATVSGTVTTNQIQHMPSFGRDVFQLMQLAPGVFGDGSQAGGGGGNNIPGTQGPGATGGNAGIFATENGPQALAHGSQYENNGISVDGISTTSAVWGGTTIITPSEDSVESVKVVSNSYDAEHGRFSGAQIEVISKSGTNNFHGSAFFTAHRPGLDAYQPFNGLNNSVLRDENFFDQFGGSIGGPIWKNKIFAFFNYETVRSPKAQKDFANGWYETPEFDASAPGGSLASTYLTFPGAGVNAVSLNSSTCTDAGLIEGTNCATIPGHGLDIGSPLTTGLGTQDFGWTGTQSPGTGGDGLGGANNLDGVADIGNYRTASSSTYSKAQYNGRLDAILSAKDRLAFAIYWVPQDTTFLNGPSRDYNLFHHQQVNNAYSVIWNRTISPTFLNEARVNAAGWRWNEITSNPQSPVGLPTANIDQVGGLVGDTNIKSFGPNVGSILNQWTYSYKDVATKIWGRHTLKFGGDVTRLFYLNECTGCGVPSYAFFNIWDFLNDAPHSESSGFDPNTGTPFTQRQDDRTNIWGFFAQDDYKVRSNLTVNLGMRWSYFGPLSSKENNMLAAFPGPGSAYLTGLTVRKANSWNPQKDNFGPQVGFAWSPTVFHDKFVVRGGYGLSFNQEEIAISANINTNPGLIIFPTFFMANPADPNPGIIYAPSNDVHSLTGYPANPNATATFGSNGLPTTGTVNVGIFPRDLPTQRTHHYSLDTQWDMGHQFVASLGYQGSRSHDIFFHSNPNATPAALGYALNPQIGGGDNWGVNGYGNYNAMLVELKRNFSQQFMVDTQFTWAKSLDTSSAPYSEQPYPFSPAANYGRSDYNVGKAFKLYGMWQPVFFHGNRAWLDKIVGGWSISGIFNLHTGFPWSPVVNVQGGSLYCGTCGYGTLFPGAYLGGAGNSTSNDQFRTGTNYPNGAQAYFSFPNYTAYSGSGFGNANPQVGMQRNSLTGPGYRDVDLSLAKGFGLPNTSVLGENAKIEFRLDAFNIFNNLNFDSTSISNGIGDPGNSNPDFGRATSALSGRVITLSARFSF